MRAGMPPRLGRGHDGRFAGAAASTAPTLSANRGQMTAFLTKTFNLHE
jgi:hypothetical protein